MKKNFPYLLMHLIIFIWGFTGLFGKMENISAVFIVVSRSFIGALALLLLSFCYGGFKSLILPRKHFFSLALIGFLIGIHWICFFRSIQQANISIGVACLSLSSLFLLFFQKLFFPSIGFRQIGMSLLVMLGISFIFQVDPQYHQGILWGVLAAALGALFSLANQHLTHQIPPLVAGFWQLFFAFLFSSIFAFLIGDSLPLINSFSYEHYLGLLFLGLLATALPMSLLVYILKKVPAFSFALSVNLEPIYSIILAYLLFGETEKMDAFFYLGFLIILSSILFDLYFQKRIITIQIENGKN